MGNTPAKARALCTAITQEDLEKVRKLVRRSGALCAVKAPDRRIPLLYACALGNMHIVKHMLDVDRPKKKISSAILSLGLVENCAGRTSTIIINALIASGADVNAGKFYKGSDTPAIALARADSHLCGAQQMAEKRKALVTLVGKSVNLEITNDDKMTPLTMACKMLNEPMAHLIAGSGGRIIELHIWMQSKPKHAKNWVAGSVLNKFAWKDPAFVRLVKLQLFSVIDRDNSGHVDREEAIELIAMTVKFAFKAGLCPTTQFEDDGSLDVSDVKRLLKQREPQLIERWLGSLDKDSDGDYTWEELLPLCKDFYHK
jgi:hypothetical protein|tara:strand:+ start:287 stop:1231 length:945 start_codon:yes stop_codon:yes gene_type:complete